jgi:hypothetical protein
VNEHTRSSIGYIGGAIALIGGLTLNEWAALIGIIVAVATLLVNLWLAIRRNRREARLFEYQTGQRVDRRHLLQYVLDERRKQHALCKTCPLIEDETTP